MTDLNEVAPETEKTPERKAAFASPANPLATAELLRYKEYRAYVDLCSDDEQTLLSPYPQAPTEHSKKAFRAFFSFMTRPDLSARVRVVGLTLHAEA